MNDIKEKRWDERYSETLNYSQILYWQIERINNIRGSADILNNTEKYNAWSGSILQLAIEVTPFQDKVWEKTTGEVKA